MNRTRNFIYHSFLREGWPRAQNPMSQPNGERASWWWRWEEDAAKCAPIISFSEIWAIKSNPYVHSPCKRFKPYCLYNCPLPWYLPHELLKIKYFPRSSWYDILGSYNIAHIKKSIWTNLWYLMDIIWVVQKFWPNSTTANILNCLISSAMQHHT